MSHAIGVEKQRELKMPIVCFNIDDDSEGLHFELEAHGSVNTNDLGKTWTTEIDAIYICWDGSRWHEVDENFLAQRLEKNMLMDLLSNIEDSMITTYINEEGLDHNVTIN